MGIEITQSDAPADAIASVRMEGLRVSPNNPILRRLAAGELTSEQARQEILASLSGPSVAKESEAVPGPSGGLEAQAHSDRTMI